MPQYKVTLDSVDKNDEAKNVLFSTFVEADNSKEAIEKAKLIQENEKPGLNRPFFWSAYETAEKRD